MVTVTHLHKIQKKGETIAFSQIFIKYPGQNSFTLRVSLIHDGMG